MAAVGKALVLKKTGGPDAFELDSAWSVGPPQAGDVLVKLAATSVNPVDTYIRCVSRCLEATLALLPSSSGPERTGHSQRRPRLSAATWRASCCLRGRAQGAEASFVVPTPLFVPSDTYYLSQLEEGRPGHRAHRRLHL